MRLRDSASGSLLRLLAALLCAGLAACDGGPRDVDLPGHGAAAPMPRHVLLISLDTLRADHLGCYGSTRPTSPNLDALAAEGILFEQAQSTAPWTLPAHASLLTGLYPSHHGARHHEERLAPGVDTLAWILRDAGFATGSVVNVQFLHRHFGMARGFDAHEQIPEHDRPEGMAERVSAAGLRWLAQQDDRRAFLFLHYFDPHSDYVALPHFRERLAPGSGRYEGRTQELMRIQGGGRAAGPDDIRHLAALYDAGIRQLDAALGRLFDRLRAEGRWDSTLVVVTSDHGEEFRDHGNVSHGHTHHAELLRVPLIVRVPGGPQGLRVREPVSLVDVAPTVLSLLGVAAPEGLDGIDLAPLWRGGTLPERTLLAETGPRMRDVLRSARRGDFKLIVDPERGRRTLFDLSTDPEEKRDVSDAHPEVVAALEDAIAELARSARPKRTTAVPPEIEERLRALGYTEE